VKYSRNILCIVRRDSDR